MDVVKKVQSGKRLNLEDGLALFELDLFTLGELAHQKRVALHGKKSYFNSNRHINPTNICVDVCKFCAYSATRKNPNPYTMSHDEVLKIVDEVAVQGVKEVHIVSAHNKEAGLSWYLDMFKGIKAKHPTMHIKALTAAEVHFLATTYHMSYDEILDAMIANGVDSMPGGGAEIFDENVREKICKGKVSSQQWLEIHALWHQKKRKSNATMLFGHIESKKDRVDHMLRLREVQDNTGGFNSFIPLVYQTQNNYLNVQHAVTGQEVLKTMAVSRLMLDNIPHIKAYWVTSTINLALLAQEFGANDLDGTIQKESINSAAGAQSANGLAFDDFVGLIKNAGFLAVERDSLYNELKQW